MSNKETYLGDGLYASFDGYQFILRAPREMGDDWVALEPEVLKAFMDFVARMRTPPSRTPIAGTSAPIAESGPSTPAFDQPGSAPIQRGSKP